MRQKDIYLYLADKYDVSKEDIIWLVKQVSLETKDYLRKGIEVRWNYLGKFKKYKDDNEHK